MQRTRTISLRHRAPIQPPMAEATGGPPTPPPSLSWCQRLAQQWVRPRRGHSQPRSLRCAAHWDAQHEHLQPRTADHPLDLLARACGDDLRMALYHLML